MDQPQGTKTQKALRWVATEMKLRPEVSRGKLLNEAALRFDLDPRESNLLFRKLTEGGEEK